jgi:hypothetical protein
VIGVIASAESIADIVMIKSRRQSVESEVGLGGMGDSCEMRARGEEGG